MQHVAHPRRSSLRAQSSTHWLLSAALAGLAGCGSDAMSLGSNESAVEPSSCQAVLDGDIVASDQADIDALRGCHELPGSLRVVTPSDAPGSISLEPLAELQRVKGQLQISGPITSLAGLESLESVGVLHLRGTALTDLLPLRALSRVDTPADWRVDSILIENCNQLHDLRGLESLTTWGSLLIMDADELVSLAGLQAPDLLESVRIVRAPQLADLSALAPARAARFIDITNTAVQGFEDFMLERADTLHLYGNAMLTSLDGLDRFEEVVNLFVTDNDALVRMDLPRLGTYDNVSIEDNDALLTILQPRTGWSTSQTIGPNGSPSGFPRGSFAVSRNPLVTSIVLGDPYDFETVVISENASLVTLGIPYMARADSLWIQNNPVLASVEVPLLHQVGQLEIHDNPALSVAPFAGVQTFQSEITGNLDSLGP